VLGCRPVTSGLRHDRSTIDEFPFSRRVDSYASTVTLSRHQLSRRLIFGGFALLALSTVISFYNYVSPSYLGGTGYSTYAQLVLETLSALFAAGGWWFLCQLEAKDSAQKSLFAKAYLVLGLQFAASCIGQLLRAGHVIFIVRFSAPFWITALGFGVGAVGFFLASFTIREINLVPSDS